MRLRWTRIASDDLTRIRDYLREHYPSLTKRTIESVREAARGLKLFPLCGKEGREPGTRELHHARMPYVLVYRERLAVPPCLSRIGA
jgi:plasmid stabilization system protein ParE